MAFTFFIIPLFLFSTNFEILKFENAKNHVASRLTIQSRTPSQAAPSVERLAAPEEALAEISLGEIIKHSGLENLLSRLQKNGWLKNSQRDKLAWKKRPSSSLTEEEIMNLNDGKAFRSGGPRFRPDELLVKFKSVIPDEMKEAAITAYNAKKLKRIPGLDIYQLQIPEGTTVEEMLYALRQNPDVEYAEPNYILYATATPNDILFRYQYALHNSGQEIGSGGPRGTGGADVKAVTSWEETKGLAEVVIAILDTGVDMEHPDLKNKIHSRGYDFVNDDSDATDDNAHGTHVAGIAAADTNNSEGMAGVAWNCKILPVKVLDEDGGGDYADAIDGIRWAADNGAGVINMSFGGDYPSLSLENALRYAFDKKDDQGNPRNIVIVAAAGNEGGAVLYPAAYDEYCLAVAATDYNDERVTFTNSGGEWESNFGPEIDVAAPGQRVLGPVPTWWVPPEYLPYAWGYGTSASAPHAAGLAALIKSIKPNLTATDIMRVIRYSAQDVNSASYPRRDDFLGYGRMNMENALVPIIVTPTNQKK